MAQINLLKQNKPASFESRGIVSLLNKFFIVCLLGLAAYYGWTVFRLRSTKSEVKSLNEKIAKQKQELSEIERRDEVLARQSQIKELDTLISNHIYWSPLLPELAKVTLKTASYLSFKVGNESGTLALQVRVPTLEELDKFLQVFDSPKINRYFSDLRMGGINRVQDGDQSSISIDVSLKFDPALLRYQTKN